MQTTARWEGNTLMVRWFGGKQEDESAFGRQLPDGKYMIESDGYDECFRRRYPEQPTAEKALQDILDWQNGW